MKEKLAQKFRDAPLNLKITSIICMLTLTVTIFIIATTALYYNYIADKKTLTNAQSAANNAVNTVSINYRDILERLVAVCGTSEFIETLESFRDPDVSETSRSIAVQEYLTELTSCNFLVNSVLFLSGDGQTYYSLYKNPIRSTTQSLISDEELATINGVAWLSERNSPFYRSVSVIPLVVPLKITEGGKAYVSFINEENEQPDLYVILMLESSRLQNSLTASGDTGTDGVYLIADSDGNILNPASASDFLDVVQNTQTITLIQDLAAGSDSTAAISNSGYYLAASGLDYTNLFLLYCVRSETLADTYGPMSVALLLLLAIVVLILLSISISMTHFITRPLHSLMNVIDRISQNTYQEPVVFSTNDEMGALCRSINNMYDTIQMQMIRIKEEEEKKYMAEIKLLTEQINPHFLYNTLECIRLEVLDENTQTASTMIQYLADYLRIGLSYGDDLISIPNELRHVNSYIKIMNQRFRQSISFLYKVAPSLEQHSILKMLLQPMAENSIKHGFSIDGKGFPIPNPVIEIRFFVQDTWLCIEVADNGSGFDIKKTEDILYYDKDSDNRHIGLHNIYDRLITFYGKENVSFQLDSVPYYRNSILIRISLNMVEEKENEMSLAENRVEKE